MAIHVEFVFLQWRKRRVSIHQLIKATASKSSEAMFPLAVNFVLFFRSLASRTQDKSHYDD